MLVALTREVHTKAKRETLRFKVEVNTNFVIPKKFSPICKNVLINNLTNVLFLFVNDGLRSMIDPMATTTS